MHPMDCCPSSPAIKDPVRVDLRDAREVRAWCLLLHVAESDLRRAVEVVGSTSAIVATYLASRIRTGRIVPVHPFGDSDPS